MNVIFKILPHLSFESREGAFRIRDRLASCGLAHEKLSVFGEGHIGGKCFASDAGAFRGGDNGSLSAFKNCGGAVAGTRARVAALLMALAAVAAGLVAPGVIPAIADTTIVFVGYLAAGVFLVTGAILAWIDRGNVRVRTPAGT